MSDYIERDLLLAEIKELKKSPWYNGGYGTYERNIRREAIDIIVDLCIKSAPTADVVEVVRCKDCKYWQDNNDGYPHQECRWGNYETPDPDDYCSYGELKDGDTE